MNKSITFEESNFSNNGLGIVSSLRFSDQVSLHMQIKSCTFNGNQHFAMLFHKHEDNKVNSKIDEIHNNSFNVNKGNLQQLLFIAMMYFYKMLFSVTTWMVGFNQNLHLAVPTMNSTRTQQLMEGQFLCSFRYDFYAEHNCIIHQ